MLATESWTPDAEAAETMDADRHAHRVFPVLAGSAMAGSHLSRRATRYWGGMKPGPAILSMAEAIRVHCVVRGLPDLSLVVASQALGDDSTDEPETGPGDWAAVTKFDWPSVSWPSPGDLARSRHLWKHLRPLILDWQEVRRVAIMPELRYERAHVLQELVELDGRLGDHGIETVELLRTAATSRPLRIVHNITGSLMRHRLRPPGADSPGVLLQAAWEISSPEQRRAEGAWWLSP